MSTDAASDDSPAASPVTRDAAPVFLMDGTRTSSASRRILPYDFRNPAAISQSDLRFFETLYKKYVQNLSVRLSTTLRMECSLKTTKLNSVLFSEFFEVIPNPSCITLFRLEDMRGVGVLDVSLPVALAMADRLLGGKGQTPATARQLTEIEMALMEDALQIILSGWEDLWTSGTPRSLLRIIAHETNTLCLPMTSTSEVCVMLQVEISLGDTKGQLNLGVPFSMVGPSVRRIQESHHHLSDAVAPKQVQWRSQYAGIAVPVVAEWKIREMPLAETLLIRMGDIIELPGSLIDNASLHLSKVATFTGTVGIQNGKIAVQISGRSNKE